MIGGLQNLRDLSTHPGVIIWSFRNERESSAHNVCALTERLVDAVKEEVPSRIGTFACRYR